MDIAFIIGIVVVVLIIAYFLFIRFIKDKTPKKNTDCPISIEQLIEALGGKDNIIDVSSTTSRLKVSLKDHHLAQVENIKTLGASGIVEGSNYLTMIFGQSSLIIAEILEKSIKD